MRYAGGYNIPGAAGNLAMAAFNNYLQPLERTLLYTPEDDVYSEMQDLAGMPRRLYGNYPAPRGAIIKAPHIDSPYMDEQIRRGFVPMTPPVRRPGPQLPGFV